MSLRPLTPSPAPSGPLSGLSRFMGGFRWAFMPLGLLSLIAVGVHAATDTVDDRLLALVDLVDAAFDRLVGGSSWTEGWVDLLSLEQRTLIARGLALMWELAVDLVLALPALGYRESQAPRDEEPWRKYLPQEARPGWKSLFARSLRKPTMVRWVRPLATAAVVLAGACAVARLVQGTVYLSWRELLGEGAADGAARGLALAALAGILATLGWRAVLRNLQHADAASQAHVGSRWQALSYGLVGSALSVPLALAAVLDASPILSFVR
ncbi:hypothetical protein POL68_13655 [Stigmatella sp. ncwal1]|uniref:Uncharacterized protein n=1 Tax=Stigmatella ashevillensis TaxID=2995309 RepID=A0ABT5D781_9BACT|nr:hypothetical protein [Stigmatella ashevillena]MDC0709510.1 hypothetical protein [Stigmatella ashevillena]